ncbi:MAG TPA: glycosyltransferase [Planctomycetaceae bacterium]|nr:glycosyltransferase [Planctomycetaceae bacterium]
MFFRGRTHLPLADRGPLRVMFITTFMPVGGAETLLTDLVRRLDRTRFIPELCCLKHLGPLGEVLAQEVPTFTGLLSNKYDVRVLPRLTGLLKERQIDAIVTVGAGDRMFWGRLAAAAAGVPVVLCALHSTGWPDKIQRLNRMLTRLTDAFIGVADRHGRFLVDNEGFPPEKVRVIPNGIDINRFAPRPIDPALRARWNVGPNDPTAGIVAALRPEKNHDLFLEMAQRVLPTNPQAKFLIVGDGAERARLEEKARELGVTGAVRFCGNQSDIPTMLSLMDVSLLTSHVEAAPVSILEAMACGKPVVSTRVGSVSEMALHGETGWLVQPGDVNDLAKRVTELFRDPAMSQRFGETGRRRVVEKYSVELMVKGYEELLTEVYASKATSAPRSQRELVGA